jgi:hypothetical protein
MTDFSVVFKGALLPGDVTAAQIAIWNSGSAPIKSEDVLSPILIQTENNAPILEITLRKISRRVTGISIDQENIHSGTARIDWRILEKDDGCVLQIIYLGATNLRLSVSGDIVGQKRIEELKYLGKISTPEEQYRVGGNVWLIIVFKLFCYSMLAVGIYALLAFIRSYLPGAKPSSWRTKIGLFVSSLYLIGLSALFLFIMSRPEPPFGF